MDGFSFRWLIGGLGGKGGEKATDCVGVPTILMKMDLQKLPRYFRYTNTLRCLGDYGVCRIDLHSRPLHFSVSVCIITADAGSFVPIPRKPYL